MFGSYKNTRGIIYDLLIVLTIWNLKSLRRLHQEKEVVCGRSTASQ